MRKIVWTYGLIGGAIIIALFFVGLLMSDETQCEMGTSELVGYTLMMLIGGATIFVGVKQYKDKYHEGKLKFGRAFLVGFYMSLIASGVYTVGWMSYTMTEKGSQWGERYTTCQVDSINAKTDLTEAQKTEEITTLKSQMEMYNNPGARTLMTLMEILPVYLLISLIAAAILMTRKQAA